MALGQHPFVLSSFYQYAGLFPTGRKPATVIFIRSAYLTGCRQKTPADERGLCRPEPLSRYGDATHTYKTVPVMTKSYALSSVQPPDITRTCALASVELIAHHSRAKARTNPYRVHGRRVL